MSDYGHRDINKVPEFADVKKSGNLVFIRVLEVLRLS